MKIIAFLCNFNVIYKIFENLIICLKIKSRFWSLILLFCRQFGGIYIWQYLYNVRLRYYAKCRAGVKPPPCCSSIMFYYGKINPSPYPQNTPQATPAARRCPHIGFALSFPLYCHNHAAFLRRLCQIPFPHN